jgi:hypothetical protein
VISKASVARGLTITCSITAVMTPPINFLLSADKNAARFGADVMVR